jgi:hypothetical protein
VVIEDQDHTHAALNNGDVVGCVSAQKTPMRGRVAEPLGNLTPAGCGCPCSGGQVPHPQRCLVVTQPAGHASAIFF